jgi:hypothetical protein
MLVNEILPYRSRATTRVVTSIFGDKSVQKEELGKERLTCARVRLRARYHRGS